MSRFNVRVRDAAAASGCWEHPCPYESHVLCVPWRDEVDLLDEMGEGLHGEHARSIALVHGAVAFSRWEGFPVAWGAETFEVVSIEKASKDVLQRALRGLIATTMLRPATREGVSGRLTSEHGLS